jgi:hypothetical protein
MQQRRAPSQQQTGDRNRIERLYALGSLAAPTAGHSPPSREEGQHGIRYGRRHDVNDAILPQSHPASVE